MANEQEIAYHRTFLSRYYVYQVVADIRNGAASGSTMTDQDIAEMGTEAFEEAREALAQLLKAPYRPAKYVSYEGDRGGGYVVEGNPPDAQVVKYLRPRKPPQVNPATRVPAVIDPSVGIVNAYLDGNALLPTTIWYKLDQQFDDYASGWEKAFSTLMAPYHSGYTPAYAFTPIVDQSYQVVGYYGTMSGDGSGRSSGGRFLVPEGLNEKLGHLGWNSPSDALAQKVPIMAWPSGTGRVPGWVPGNIGFPDVTYGVRTQPDGRVLWSRPVSERGAESSAVSPLDFYFAGKALLSLGKLGAGLIKSLLIKEAAEEAGTVVLDGATKEASDAAMRKLDEEIADASRDLIKDPGKNKAWGRALSHTDMQQLVRSKWSQNPFLRRFRSAFALAGEARKKEIIAALDEMEEQTGKVVQVVPDGLGKTGGFFEGEAGWALNANTRQQVLAITEKAFRDPEALYNEVVHDVAFDVVREANGVPYLRDFQAQAATEKLKGAVWWMEQYIMRGDEGLSFLDEVEEP